MKPKILLCLDSDPQPSVFDAVVAVDAGVDHLLRHGGVGPSEVRDLVYGAMFTRGGDDLRSTAIFIGGRDVEAGEQLLAKVRECFFGPVRVSVLLDSNGANTTAAAAVVALSRHVELRGSTVAVLAGTGSVGRRVVKLLVSQGARVRLGSRTRDRGAQVAAKTSEPDLVHVCEVSGTSGLSELLDSADAVIACGPPGVELLPRDIRGQHPSIRVAIDLNAVPPLGVAGIEVTDKAADRDGCTCYGALGVGGLKMKIHRAAIERLFATNDAMLDADEVYALGRQFA